MDKIVIKRDGREKEFSELRVLNAVTQAYASVYNGNTTECRDEIKKVVENICGNVTGYGRNRISVEKINDFMMNELKSTNKEVYKSALKYRREREKARQNDEYTVYREISNAVKNDITKENANMCSESPAGMMMKYASEITRKFTKAELLDDVTLQAVEDNILHIHDMDYYPTRSLTCLQHPLDKIMKTGFTVGKNGTMRPAKRIMTASFMACMSMQDIQNEMHGGQAIPAFDFYMAPYVRMTLKEELDEFNEAMEIMPQEALDELFKYLEVEEYSRNPEEMKYKFNLPNAEGHTFNVTEETHKLVKIAIKKTTKDTHQAMEAFIHNMNSIRSRGGNQTVFSSINYGTDTSAEGRCVIRELLNSTYEGVGNGETAIFPIQIWKKKKGVNFKEGEPNYDLFKLAMKVTAKRFFPNYVNLDASFNTHDKWDANDPERYKYEIATMGCRTRVFEDIHGEKTSIARGNLSFSTINIVKLGILAMKKYPNDQDKRIEYFFELLDKYTDICAEQLHKRFEFQCEAKAYQFPLLMKGMWVGSEKLKPTDEVREVLKHGTLGVGFIGLAECLIALTGHHHGESEESQELGLKIIGFINDKCQDYKKKYDLNYSCFATPAEGLSGKFTKKDKVEFGEIPGVTDKDYYTNSNHVPVYYKIGIEDKIRIEAPYHKLTPGGHIMYIELDGDVTKNVSVIEKIIDLYDKYDIGYGSINFVRSRCLDCGFENTDKDLIECPQCHSTNIDTIERITGYLVGSVGAQWNSGKIAELKDRVSHATGEKMYTKDTKVNW